MPYYTDGPIGADAGLQDLAPSLGMSVGAAVDDAFTSNPSKVIYDYSKFSRANDGPKLDRTEAEARVKDAGVSLKIPDSGYSEDALGLLIDRKRDEITRQSILARAPAGIVPSTARFAASLLTGVLDPLNVASAFVPVVGQARYAEMLAGAGGALGRAGVRLAVGGAEGAVGAALVEPINYFGRTQMQDDYHMTDSLLNLAMGAGLGGVLHTGGGAIGDKLGISDFARSLEVRRADEVRAAQMRAEAGRPDEPISIAGLSAKQAEAIDRVHQEMGTGKYAPDSAAARAAEMTPEGREASLRVAVAQAMDGRMPEVDVITGADAQASGAASFTTAKGSVYEAHADGTTSRDKAARPEHPGEEGPQPRSERTVYVTEDALTALGEIQAKGGARMGLAFDDTTNSAGLRYLEGKDAGRIEGRTVVPFQREPAVGLYPVEHWGDGKTVHFGNQITEVRRPGVADPVATARATAERQASPESVAVADFNASRAADERIAAEAKTDPAQEMLTATTAKLDALLKNLEQRGMDPARVEAMRAELEPFDAALADSKKLGNAMKAAAICGLRA